MKKLWKDIKDEVDFVKDMLKRIVAIQKDIVKFILLMVNIKAYML